ncbi:hypothetical protein AtNW77_Chr4g0320181 [Arabidopsis thaliana]
MENHLIVDCIIILLVFGLFQTTFHIQTNYKWNVIVRIEHSDDFLFLFTKFIEGTRYLIFKYFDP